MTAQGPKARFLTAAGPEEVAISELPARLGALADPNGPVVWVHMEGKPAFIQALDELGLDEVAVKSLRDGPERPRVEEFADHMYISIFSADNAEGTDEDAPGGGRPEARSSSALPRLRELRLFMGARWIISVGHVRANDYQLLTERVKRQVLSQQRGPSFIAYHICEWVVESLQPALERLDDRIDGLEDQVVLATGEAPMQELFGLKRDLVDLRRRVAPLRDVMQRLGSHGVVYVEPEAEVYFRDVHDDVMRVIELLDTYRDILSSALDLYLSSVSNRLNVVMKQLTVVATMFLPLSFIVGLFGVNFTRMPFGSLLWFVAMFVLMVLSVLAMVLYTRKKA
jgi:magnesium transporter